MSRMNFTGYRDPVVWAELGLMGDRLSFTNDEVVTKLGIGYIKEQRAECAMDTAVRYTLLNAGENGAITAKQMLNPYTRLAALVEENIIADGWYRPDATEENPFPKPVRAWVYEENMNKLWDNIIISSYSINHTHFGAGLLGKKVSARKRSKYQQFWIYQEGSYYYGDSCLWKSDNFTTFPVAGNERALTNTLDDKTVLRAINKSLNRMTKSGKAIQVTHGRGRTFRWDAWGWLDNYRQKHLVTMAKQRKLGDVVNGWEYTKGRVSNMHGVEICDHEWHPHEPVQAFTISMKIPKWDTYYNSGVTWVQNALPYLFFNEDEAREALEDFKRLPSNGISMKIDGLPTMPQCDVTQRNVKMTVAGSAEIEKYLSPQEMYMRMQLGDKAMYKHFSQMLRDRPPKIAGNLTTEKEE